MSETRQSQGLSLMEQGFKSIIQAEVEPQIEKISKDIEAASQKFELIKQASEKSLEEAKNLVKDSIAKEIDQTKRTINVKIDNIVSRLQGIEKDTMSTMNLYVKEREKQNQGDRVEFAIPPEGVEKICYTIDGNKFEANVSEDGKSVKGPHIKSGRIENKKYIVDFEKKLDQGESFSIVLDKPNVLKKIELLLEKIDKNSKLIQENSSGIKCIKNALKNFSKQIDAIDEKEKA